MPTEKRNWLLLRGLARGTGHWGAFAQKIQEKFPNDDFEFLDLPGNGTQNLEVSPWSIPAYVEHARKRCRFVAEQKKFRILTLSLGAMVAVEWMRRHPEEVLEATLLCTSSRGFNPFYHRFLIQNYVAAAKMGSSYKDAKAWETGLLQIVTNNVERRQQEIPGFIEFTQKHPLSLQNILRQLWAASRYQFPKTAPGRIQLIGSYGDRLVHPTCSQLIGQAWGLSVDMHPSAGHDIPIDDPDWLLERLL